jgi:glycosyltransferase involved in cell wall biosynthesis
VLRQTDFDRDFAGGSNEFGTARDVRWTILSPEFPPTSGGVADHTAQLAEGLIRQGDRVEVWAPAAPGSPPSGPHTSCDFDAAGRRALSEAISAGPPTVVLVHYVPLTYGRFNPGFFRWLDKLEVPVWVMFHEVAYPFARGQAARHRLLALMTHWTARKLARRADRVLVSTESWEPVLRRLAPAMSAPVWLPISSNISASAARPATDVRAEFGLEPGDSLVAHFGTFRDGRDLTERLVRRLLERNQNTHVVLAGRNAEAFVDSYWASPEARLHVVGQAPKARIAEVLTAADALFFPFVDGVTTRRTSLMAGLCLGRPIVTTRGAATEPFWSDSACVELAEFDVEALARQLEALLSDRARCQHLATIARRTYEERFTVDHAVQVLRAMRAPRVGA